MESEFIKSFKFVETIDEKDLTSKWNTRIGHVSASALKRIKISPAHFIEEEKKEKTPAMEFGSAYHCFILEPDKFDQEYFVFDERDIIEKLIGEGSKKPRGTNAYEEWKDAQFSFAQGKIMIDLQMMETLKEMKKRLFSNRYIAQLLSDGEPERVFYCTLTTMENKEVNVIMRTDFIKPKKRAIIELKTAIDASKDGFPHACGEFDYHIQAALYKDFMEFIQKDEIPWSFFYIVQETKRPYAYNLFEASPQFIAQGRYEYEMLIMLYTQCVETGRWPGYQVFCQNRFGINELNLPGWSIKDLTFYNHK